MSIVLVKGSLMVCDGLSYSSFNQFGPKIKIYSDALIGSVGRMDHADVLEKWFVNGRLGKPEYFGEDSPDATLLVLTPDTLKVVYSNGYIEEVPSKIYAIGCGAPAAMVCMDMDLDPIETVKSIAKMIPGCGLPVYYARCFEKPGTVVAVK